MIREIPSLQKREKLIMCRKKMCNENNTYFMLEILTDFYMEPDYIWDRGSLLAIAPNSRLEIFGFGARHHQRLNECIRFRQIN